MTILSAEEVNVAASALGLKPADLKTTAIARLYKCPGGSNAWAYTGVCGVVAIVQGADNLVYLRLVDLKSNKLAFEQELYHSFDYTVLSPSFHAFESDDCTYGLCFAEECDSNAFHAIVKGLIFIVNSMKMAGTSSNPAPPATTAATATGNNKTPSAPTTPATNAVGDFLDKINPFKKKPKPKKVNRNNVRIGRPENYQHVSHIGFTPGKGFEVRNIPPQWKSIFEKAGVKDEELQNPETAAFLMKQMTKETRKVAAAHAPPPPPAPNAAAPPPPPPVPLSLADQISGAKLKKAARIEPKDVQFNEKEENDMASAIKRAMDLRRQGIEESDSDEEEDSDDDDDDWD